MTPQISSQSNRFLDNLIQDIITRYDEEKSLGTDSCRNCRKSNTVVSHYDCPICGPLSYCDEHVTRHVAMHHSTDPIYERVRNLKVRDYMLKGIISAFYTPDQVITLGGEFPNQARSNFYEEAAYRGWERACIISCRPPESPDKEQQHRMERTFIKQVQDFLELLGLRAYNWTATKNLSLFAAMRTEGQYLPEDITSLPQDSSSGLVFNPSSKPGKIMKRLRVGTQAEGAWFVPEPSLFPELKLPGEIVHRAHAQDTGTTGDGSGSYRRSAAKELVEASGANWTDDIIAVQTSFLAADYAGKGMFSIVEDHLFPGPTGTDFVIDKESINQDVVSTRSTKGKVTPIRHKPNSRQVYVEPLILGEVVSRFIDPAELATQANILANKADQETWQKALEEDQTELLSEETAPGWTSSKRPHLDTAISRRGAEDKTLTAYLASGNSPFASPQVMDRIAGGTAKHWESRAKRSAPMPGIMASGEAVWLMHPGYAQTPSPGPGYVGLVWRREQPDQLTGVTLSRSDLFKHRDALDTVDCDDKLTLIFMTGEQGQCLALVLRLPLSIDGGVCLKVKRADARKLQQLGYHFYRKAGGHRWPGLYTLQKGQPIFPYRLEAQPFERPPTWTTSEENALSSMLELTKYRAVIGQVTNLSANLDYTGLYDPDLFKFCLSESIIDPSLNASADPTPVIQPLEDSLLEAMYRGVAMDPCVFERIEKRIGRIHRSRTGSNEELEVKLECQRHHDVNRAGMKKAIGLLTERLRMRKLSANGPPEWLTRTFDPELEAIVVQAFSQRSAAWSKCATERYRIRKDEEITQSEREAKTAQLIVQAKRTEAEAISLAYLNALHNVKGYAQGEFIALWVQLALSSAKRFKSGIQPISTHCLNALPTEEHVAYHSGGATAPTAALRTTGKANLEPGQKCRIEKADMVGPKERWRLVTPQGKLLTTMEREAALFIGCELTVLGYTPKIGPKENWEQIPNLLVLRTDVPAIPG